MKKIKPIKAWALTSRQDGACIYAYWTFDNRNELRDGQMFHREGANGHFDPKHDKWIRVEIRPLDFKPPKKKQCPMCELRKENSLPLCSTHRARKPKGRPKKKSKK